MGPATRSSESRRSRKANVALWIVQLLLAALFCFAGYTKLAMPAELLAQQTGLPAPFMRFIGLAELAGGLGLVLPGLLRAGRALTSFAAAGLLSIMAGATALTIGSIGAAPAALPLVVGMLAAVVACGRWQGASDRAPARRALAWPVGMRTARSAEGVATG